MQELEMLLKSPSNSASNYYCSTGEDTTAQPIISAEGSAMNEASGDKDGSEEGIVSN